MKFSEILQKPPEKVGCNGYISSFKATSSWKVLIYQIISKPTSLLYDINNREKDKEYNEQNI